MKNAIRTFAMLLALAFTTSAFAAYNPTPSAMGSFKCNVIKPIAIAVASETVELGQLIQGETRDLSAATGNVLTWNITGENNHAYFYEVTQSLTNGAGVTIAIKWAVTDGDAPTTPFDMDLTDPVGGAGRKLTATGTSKITATCTSISATDVATLGPQSIAQTVKVSYSSF